MMISTRGRYALRVLIDMAENGGDGYLPMKEIAARQGISLKYLEKILPGLVEAGYIEGVHGKGGGYKFIKDPGQCRVSDILRVTDGDLAPVACLEEGAKKCERSEKCRTLPLWDGLNDVITAYLDGVTIADLMKECAETGATI